jgi:hypothetical protein
MTLDAFHPGVRRIVIGSRFSVHRVTSPSKEYGDETGMERDVVSGENAQDFGDVVWHLCSLAEG